MVGEADCQWSIGNCQFFIAAGNNSTFKNQKSTLKKSESPSGGSDFFST